jgi:anti-sigma B factor antagonist
MTLDKYFVGDITVMTIRGKVTLETGDELLKDSVNTMLASGRFNLVLDLGGVSYIDSAGNGEFVRTHTTVFRQGGRMVICNLTKRIKDLWSINKLLTLYETYESVADAVQSFRTARFEVSCPVCRPVSWTRLFGRGRVATCDACDTRFVADTGTQTLTLLEDRRNDQAPPDVTAVVKRLWWTTYVNDKYGAEGVQLRLGRPSTVSISGRLDLFTLDAVETAWQSIPRPRRVVFDLTGLRTATAAARARLEDLCAVGDDDSRAAIVARSDSDVLATKRRSARSNTFVDRDRAIRMLGTLQAGAESLEVKIRCRV